MVITEFHNGDGVGCGDEKAVLAVLGIKKIVVLAILKSDENAGRDGTDGKLQALSAGPSLVAFHRPYHNHQNKRICED